MKWDIWKAVMCRWEAAEAAVGIMMIGRPIIVAFHKMQPKKQRPIMRLLMEQAIMAIGAVQAAPVEGPHK